MIAKEDLLTELKGVLDQAHLQIDTSDDGKNSRLRLPDNGVAIRDVAQFANALSPGTSLADFLKPSTMGFGQLPPATASNHDTPPDGLYLTRLEFSSDNDEASYLVDLQWRGTSWELIEDIIMIHEPGITLSMTPGTAEAQEDLRANLYGGFFLADTIDVEIYVLLGRRNGANISPAIYGDLGKEGPYKLKPLLSKFGFSLPGTDDLAIDELTFFADPSNKIVSFAFSLGSVWKPKWGNGKFELTDVTFDILKQGESYSGTIEAVAVIEDTRADVTVVYTGDGWRMALELDFDPDMQLSGVLAKLGGHFGLGDVLGQAPGFETLEIARVGIEIGLDSHDLHFSMAAKDAFEADWCPFAIGKNRLIFDITHAAKPESVTTVGIDCDVEIAGQSIDVTVDYGGRDEGWTLTGSHKQDWKLDDLITKLKDDLDLGTLPLDTAGVVITDIEFNANTKKKNFALQLSGSLPAGSKTLAFTIDVALSRQADAPGEYEKRFSGRVTVGDMTFDMLFANSGGNKAFVAAYQNSAGMPASLGKLIEGITGGTVSIPDMGFGIRNAAFVSLGKTGEPGKDYLLAVDIDGGADLSKLPFVSKALPANQAVKLAFQPVYASRAFSREEADGFQELLPPGSVSFAPAPAPGVMADGRGEEGSVIAGGFDLKTHIRVGDTVFDLNLPAATVNSEHDAPESTAAGNDQVANDNANQASVQDGSPAGSAGKETTPKVIWLDVQKAMGPVHFERVGLGIDLDAREMDILLDASLGMGGLTVSVMGLGAGYSFKDKSLSFKLDGLGLSYEGGPSQIGGTFLKLGHNDFVGEAMIRTPTFGLSALGAYADRDGYKSLFVYAFLDYPLGGPPFCFIEGLAAGFGYNRHVRDMPIASIPDFPFVKEAVAAGGGEQPEEGLIPPSSGEDAQAGLTKELRSLENWIQPSDGEYFIAVGLKFTTFHIIDSFAVAIVSFGHRFRLDVLGVSNAVLPPRPPDAPPSETRSKLAVVDMAFHARYDPEEGLLGVQAELTNNSWVLSPDGHLSGGFAFCSWFAGPHEGDFVTTLGGYHPHFKAPKHYPFAQRLALKWKVSDQVEIKGTCYFALTPNAMMAGGYLSATWHCGDMWAAFTADANFLMQWKPFHYEADIDVEISGGYGSLSGSVGASLDIQGPDFSGTAHVKFLFVSFSVDFGAPQDKPNPLSWDEFRAGFLPPADPEIATVHVQSGVIRSLDKPAPATGPARPKKRWIVNPKELALATSSLLPIKTLSWHPDAHHRTPLPSTVGLTADFGVAPMHKSAVSESDHRISIMRGDKHVEFRFRLAPASKAFPAAMWGTSGSEAGLDEDAILPLLGQTVLTVRDPVQPGQTSQIPRRNLRFDTTEVRFEKSTGSGIEYAALDTPRDKAGRQNDRQTISETAERSDIRAARGALIDAFGIKTDNEIRLGEGFSAAFIVPPRVAAGTGRA